MNKHSFVVTITNMSHEGRGIAHREGKTIFVEGALVGEEVKVEIVKSKSRWDEANIIEILKSNPSRVKPECNFFGLCGGCSLQHIDSETQITQKQAILLEKLHHMGNIHPQTLLPAITAKNYGYRRKARLGVRYVHKKNKLLIGFREKNGRYLADIESCAVLHPSVGLKIPLLREFLLTLSSYLQIPQLEIAVGDTKTAIIIRHLSPLPFEDLERIKSFGEKTGYCIYLQPGGPDTATLFYPDDGLARLSYRLEDFNLEILFSPTDFTQINAEINKLLIKEAIELLKPTAEDTLLDLFCGIGNFTLPLARFAKKVIGLEGAEAMVERGYENARHNRITNVDFYCQDLTNLSEQGIWKTNFTGILIDPPRTGAWEIIQKLPHTAASRIVYVSCNPATLARDGGYLCAHGFSLTSVRVLDMFPQTSHVESIALFTRV